MLHHFKKRLILLCGITTSTILTIIVGYMFFFTLQQSEQHNIRLFEQNADMIIDKIRYANTIRHSWLSQMEGENQLIIYIEDQGYPLTYKGTAQAPVDRTALIEAAKAKAKKTGMDLSISPISASVVRSSIFRLAGINGEYRAMTVIIPVNQKWRSIVLLQYLPDRILKIVKQALLFLLIALTGNGLLFLLSSIFIGKAIKPVEENNQRQAEFIAAASHELRSPLAVISASISYFKKDITKVQNYLPLIEGECIRMTRLIDDMLLLASSDAKIWTLQKELIDTDTFLIEEYDLLCPFTNSKQQLLSLELPENPLFKIFADKERLKQVVAILVDNAVNYSPQGGTITLRAYNQKSNVVIEVIDHGIGIPDEYKDKIFDRFYRVDKSRTDKKHFGLGLCIGKELINLHKGKLYVKDTDGGGATFVINL